MRWTEIAGAARPRRPAADRAPASPRRPAASCAAIARRRITRGADIATSPGRADLAGGGPTEEPVEAAGSRGRAERAHRSLENYRTVFHELPQASSVTRKGTFLSS